MRVAVIGLRGIPDIIGGIETQCEQLYPAMLEADARLNVDLFVRRGYVDPHFRFHKGVRLLPVWAPPIAGLEPLVHTFLCLLHARFRLSPDVVHLHGIGPAVWTPLARLLGLRVVVTHHAPDYQRPKWGFLARQLLKTGEAMAARFAHRVICVSRSVQDLLLQRHPAARSRSTVIFNAVRPFAESTKSADAVLHELGLEPARYIVAVGRLDETKRFQDLLSAHDRLGEEALPLVVVGAGVDSEPHAAHLRARASGKVIFAGFRSGAQLAGLYRNAALFLHPSEMEGFGLVVLEALGLGVPVALSDIPPHREFGLPDAAYFPVGDIAAIARLMKMEQPDALRIPDRTSIVARYDLGRAALAHLELYRTLLTSRQAR